MALVLVFKLRKIITRREVDCVSETDDKQFSQNSENLEPERQAVAFEPFLFTMMLEH